MILKRSENSTQALTRRESARSSRRTQKRSSLLALSGSIKITLKDAVIKTLRLWSIHKLPDCAISRDVARLKSLSWFSSEENDCKEEWKENWAPPEKSVIETGFEFLNNQPFMFIQKIIT